MTGVIIKTVNYRGQLFDRFYPQQERGLGWFVHGRNPSYNDRYVMLCARPDVPARRRPNRNDIRSRGWRTKREAQAVADMMNAKDRDCAALRDSVPAWPADWAR